MATGVRVVSGSGAGAQQATIRVVSESEMAAYFKEFLRVVCSINAR